MIITFGYLYLENHSHIIRYARYTSENAQVVFNIVKYRKPINADNLYFIIKGEKEKGHYNPKNSIRKKI